MSGKEFTDINLGYIDKETKKETIISVPEQVEETLIPNHELQHGYTYAVGVPEFNNASIYKIETRITTGNGKHNTQGIPSYDKIVKESVSAAFKNFTDSISSFSYDTDWYKYNYLTTYYDEQSNGLCEGVSMATYIGLFSAYLKTPVIPSTVIAGEIKLSGSMAQIENASILIEASANAGAKNILLPWTCMQDLINNSSAMQKINVIFYTDPSDAVKKALHI